MCRWRCTGSASRKLSQAVMSAPLNRPLRGAILLAALVAALIAVACGGAALTPAPTPEPTGETTVLTLRPVLGSTDLSVGSNRLVFALLDSRSAPIRATAAELKLAYEQGDATVFRDGVEAVFRPWPAGLGGVFTVQVEFDRAGTWLAEFSPVDGEFAGEKARLVIAVAEQSATPGLGTPAPASDTRTASDAATLDEITSDLDPDPELYAISIADALRSGLPLVVSFATPAFCSSATCGPQLEIVKQLKEAYGDRANFIHVEIYANPKEMQGDPEIGEISPVVEEWGLPSEPYTFLIDEQGLIAAKFEAYVSYAELEEALVPLLK